MRIPTYEAYIGNTGSGICHTVVVLQSMVVGVSPKRDIFLRQVLFEYSPWVGKLRVCFQYMTGYRTFLWMGRGISKELESIVTRAQVTLVVV